MFLLFIKWLGEHKRLLSKTLNNSYQPQTYEQQAVYYCETIQIDMFYLNGWISTGAFVAMQTMKDVNSILLLF